MRNNQNDILQSKFHLRASELALRLCLSKNSVWRLTREGKLPAPIKLSDKITVWKSADIQAWLSSKEKSA